MHINLAGGPNHPMVGAHVRPSTGGIFFHKPFELPAGQHRARVQVQFSPFAREDRITVRARIDDVVVAEVSLSFSEPDAWTRADFLYLSLDLAHDGVVVFEGETSAHAASTHLRFFTLRPADADDASFNHQHPDQPRQALATVIFGTTAICNANCSHCPTNKAYSKTQKKGVMDTALFERIITELAELGFKGTIMFGLYGEPLQDPHLARRVAFIKKTCPDAFICLSTNAALYDPAKHAEALEGIHNIGVHIEAMTPEIYDQHMRPLKAPRTIPRAERLLADHMGRVQIVTPIHKDNLNEAAALRAYWEPKGALETELASLSNRAGQSPNYDAITVAPTAAGCGPSLLEHTLNIDWDGVVVTCCQDFHRSRRVGDLTTESVAQALSNAAREREWTLLNEKRWGCMDTCSGCRVDSADAMADLFMETMSEMKQMSFPASQFSSDGWAAPDPKGLRLSSRHPQGVVASLFQRRKERRLGVIFGPYRRLGPGRYVATFAFEDLQRDIGANLVVSVVGNHDEVLAKATIPAARMDGEVSLTFQIDRLTRIEFVTRAKGVDAVFTGVQVDRLDADDQAETASASSSSFLRRSSISRTHQMEIS